MTSREAVFVALFARLAAAAGFVTTSRELKHWDDVRPESQPAGFQLEGSQLAEGQGGMPSKWTFQAEWYLYVHKQNCADGQLLVSLLNTRVDALVDALTPSPVNGRQTLGGLVHDCRISGEIETTEGRLDNQAVAIIPILIIVNT